MTLQAGMARAAEADEPLPLEIDSANDSSDQTVIDKDELIAQLQATIAGLRTENRDVDEARMTAERQAADLRRKSVCGHFGRTSP